MSRSDKRFAASAGMSTLTPIMLVLVGSAPTVLTNLPRPSTIMGLAIFDGHDPLEISGISVVGHE